eukprot:4222998-Pyramimonas_sp.AAC.1
MRTGKTHAEDECECDDDEKKEDNEKTKKDDQENSGLAERESAYGAVATPDSIYAHAACSPSPFGLVAGG